MNLLNIGKSKTRQAILRLYFAHPEKRYYLRELERILEKSVANIRREMLNLEKSGLFLSEFIGKERFFRLNREYSLYSEIESIVSKTIGLDFELQKVLKRLERIEFAFIFGSFAGKQHDEFSDVDLMIIGEPNEDELIIGLAKVEKKIDREINYHIFSKKEWARKIKEKNSFIMSVDKKVKLFLIGNKNEL